MSFHSHLKNIELKTGKTREDYPTLAMEKQFMKNNLLKPFTKAGEVVQWLKDEYVFQI